MSELFHPAASELGEGAVRRSRPPYATLSACVVASAAIVTTAVYYAPAEFRISLAAGATAAAIALCAAVTTAVYFRREARHARRDADQARDDRVHAIAGAHAEVTAATEAVAEHTARSKSSESRRAAAMAAFAGAAGRMQAMTTSMLAELREMEHRHGDPTVLADLLQLDHHTAQAGRLADSIAVLSGARSGRRWAKPIAMESILRGAMGRVAGYQRVRLRAIADIAVSGHAAEGVMHALAELLDNACNFSPPTTEVHVYAAEVPAGVIITIEDSGLVMSASALRRAEAAVSATGPDARGSGLDLSSLTGTRLGLAVVGNLARKHGLTVSYRPSAIGGTAVVVVIPRDLTTRVERPQSSTTTGMLPVTRERAGATAPPERAPAEPEPVGSGTAQPSAAGPALPKRRRGSTLAAVHPEGLAAPEPATPTPPAARPDSLAAFQRAVAGRATDSAVTPSPAPSVSVENER
ncbi:sensor histidine kinase [Nocardia abscessus]|uniref:sensor histidine kinase n=1 Tax=Nocardia abscessus TaxID=120957 RepID=UPI002453B82B|nr:ATP-binding protein [Nocardia abscessus]